MLQMHNFARDDVFPSWIENALTRALSVLASQFQIVKTDATHVQLVAGANDAAAVVSIGGQWRWVEAAITLAHPGGAAGAYPMFATASNNNIQPTPAPFTDDTNYAFGLTILAPGATPTIVAGTVDVYRHVADVIWDGSQITHVKQLVPPATSHAVGHAVGGVDPLSPADIGAVPSGDSTTNQPGDLVLSAAATRAGTYAALFAAIGTTYGAGDGSTTFSVPDYRGRMIVGAGTGGGLTPRARGDSGGTEAHTHSIPSLALLVSGHTHPLSVSGGAQIHPSAPSGFELAIDWTGAVGTFTSAGRVDVDVPGAGTAAGFGLAVTEQGVALYGNTDSAIAGGATGSGTTGGPSAPFPFTVANVFIRF